VDWLGRRLATSCCVMHHAGRRRACSQNAGLVSAVSGVRTLFDNQFVWPRHGLFDKRMRQQLEVASAVSHVRDEG